jgi:hypothetical protein
MTDEEKAKAVLSVASEYAARLVRAGIPKARAVQIVARSLRRIIRPGARSRAEQIYPNPSLIPNTSLLWASGGGSTASSMPFPLFPPPPTVRYRDALTDPGFTVPFISTTLVSGGGGALAAAVLAAAPGTRLQIADSLIYDPVVVPGCTNITIEAAPGLSPQIQRVLPPHVTSGWCLSLQGVIDGFAIRGVTFHGNGNQNTISQLDDGLLNLRPTAPHICTAADRIIVEDCTFAEDGSDNARSIPGICITGTDGVLYQRISVHRCTFSNNANGASSTINGYAPCTIGGFAAVYIQNCKVVRTDAVVTRAASNMRGYLFHNLLTVVEDCLAFDLGIGGSNENYKQMSVFVGTDIAVGPSSVRNCVAYRPHRGWRIVEAGATMTLLQCVADVDLAGVLAGQTLMRQSAGTLVVRNCALSGAGDGTVFEAAVTEDHNDVFNFGATGKVLDVTDLTIDPIYQDVPLNVYVATAPALQAAGSDGGAMGVRYLGGEVIFWAG